MPHSRRAASTSLPTPNRQEAGECLLQACKELAAPLSLVQGYIESLSSGLVPRDLTLAGCLPIMERNMARMAKVVEDMSCLGTLAAGTGSNANAIPLDLKALVDKVAGQVEVLARSHGATLKVYPWMSDLVVNGDLFLWEYSLTTLIELLLAVGSGRSAVLSITCEAVHGQRIIQIADNIGLLSEQDYHRLESGAITIQGLVGTEARCTGLSLRAARQALLAQGATLDSRTKLGSSTAFLIHAPVSLNRTRRV